jgi:hypothetical protein
MMRQTIQNVKIRSKVAADRDATPTHPKFKVAATSFAFCWRGDAIMMMPPPIAHHHGNLFNL